MIHSIKDFSDRQIEELRQCPGVNIDRDNLVVEVPFIAEGLFFTIAKNKEVVKELQKEELVPISDETLSDLYLEMFSDLQKNYVEGAITHPEIDEAEKIVNEVWEKCNQGKASLSDFKEVLATFRETYSEVSGNKSEL